LIAGYDWFQPSDLQKFFHALQKATQPAILVGRQSLTFWVDYFKIPVPKFLFAGMARSYTTVWRV